MKLRNNYQNYSDEKKELIFRTGRTRRARGEIGYDFQNNKELFKNLIDNLYEKKYEMIIYDNRQDWEITLVRDTKSLYRQYADLISDTIRDDEKNLDSLISMLQEN